MTQRRTIHYFQWARAIGAVAIVFLHAIGTMRNTYGADVLGIVRVGIEEGLSVAASRWAVPVFFMMSGALMLDPAREMGWKKCLRHVWRLVFVLFTIGYAFCVIECYVGYGRWVPQVFLDAVDSLLAQNSWDHMWYVYHLAGFYLMTPFLRPWVAQASRKEYRNVLIGAFVLLQGLRTLSAFKATYTIYSIVSVPECITWYLAGYYVHNYLELDRRWIAAGLVSLAATIALDVGIGWTWAVDPWRIVCAPYGLLVMLLFKRHLDVPTTGHTLVELLADYSFGIYLLHPVFQHLAVEVVNLSVYPAVAVDVTLTVVPLLLSVVAVWVLRLVPGFKGKI